MIREDDRNQAQNQNMIKVPISASREKLEAIRRNLIIQRK
jgi:hypothetical protein